MANLYVFHQGSHESGELWYSVLNLDSSTWQPQKNSSSVNYVTYDPAKAAQN